jgi:hypothetical protein
MFRKVHRIPHRTRLLLIKKAEKNPPARRWTHRAGQVNLHQTRVGMDTSQGRPSWHAGDAAGTEMAADIPSCSIRVPSIRARGQRRARGDLQQDQEHQDTTDTG